MSETHTPPTSFNYLTDLTHLTLKLPLFDSRHSIIKLPRGIMRFILTLVIGIALGIAAVWYFNHNKNNSQFQTAGQEIKSTAQNAGNAVADKFRSWHLDRDTITNELART